jgi:hypothetical protein
MGGGLMQLVAYGAQDVYLSGNPQITFFKVVYRRHTNFAMECIEQTFNGIANVGKSFSATISRNGDLIHKMWLRAVIPATTIDIAENTAGQTTHINPTGTVHFARKFGLALLKNVELEIGGQLIDKQYGDWMNIWNELSLPESKQSGYAKLVGDGELAKNDIGVADPRYNQFTYGGFSKSTIAASDEFMGTGGTAGSIPAQEINVPLEFWFCRNPGLALPLIALQYHEVRVNFTLNPSKYLGMMSQSFQADGGGAGEYTTTLKCGSNTQTLTQTANGADEYYYDRALFDNTLVSLSNCSLWVDYIYLDTDERRRFAQTSHEYLIEQIQYSGQESYNATSATVKLHFNHPIKELVWVAQPANNVTETTYDEENTDQNLASFDNAHTNLSHGQFDYQFYPTTSDEAQDTNHIALRVSGNKIVYPINPILNAKLQLNGHDRTAERTGDYFNLIQPMQHHTRVPGDRGINVYSFALKPEEHQPSGTCNFSRIDVAELKLNLRTTDTHNVRVYATNYNVLRIMSGMGGLAFAN